MVKRKRESREGGEGERGPLTRLFSFPPEITGERRKSELKWRGLRRLEETPRGGAQQNKGQGKDRGRGEGGGRSPDLRLGRGRGGGKEVEKGRDYSYLARLWRGKGGDVREGKGKGEGEILNADLPLSPLPIRKKGGKKDGRNLLRRFAAHREREKEKKV